MVLPHLPSSPQTRMTPWGQQWHWHVALLDKTSSFFFSGTRIPTTVSSITSRVIVSFILISPFTSSSPRCLGSCGTSFKKSPPSRFSQTPPLLGCSVSPCLGKDLLCLILEQVSLLLGSHSFIRLFIHHTVARFWLCLYSEANSS